MTRFISVAILIQLTLAVALTSVTKALNGAAPHVHRYGDHQPCANGSDKEVPEPAPSKYKRPDARSHKQQAKETIAGIESRLRYP
jgi:hypothetical protein